MRILVASLSIKITLLQIGRSPSRGHLAERGTRQSPSSRTSLIPQTKPPTASYGLEAASYRHAWWPGKAVRAHTSRHCLQWTGYERGADGRLLGCGAAED